MRDQNIRTFHHHVTSVTFSYAPPTLVGGRAQSRVTLGPRPQSRDGLINTAAKPEEGHYVSRERERKGKPGIGAYTWFKLEMERQKRLAHERENPVYVESLDEWCKRHPVLGIASATCDTCHVTYYGVSAIADITEHLKTHGEGLVVYA